MSYRIAIFDLDGTILNTIEDLTDSVNYALEKNGMPKRLLSEVQQFAGNGIKRLIELAVVPFAEEEQIEQVFADFKEYYGENCARKTRPYDGIGEVIQTLRAKGVITAVVSNKADFAVQTLCADYFPGMFDLVVGEKEGIRRKPYPDSVKAVLSQFHAKKEEAVFIGDSEVDIKTAENAEMDVISVTWGFRTEEYLKSEGGTVFAHRPEELLGMILAL